MRKIPSVHFFSFFSYFLMHSKFFQRSTKCKQVNKAHSIRTILSDRYEWREIFKKKEKKCQLECIRTMMPVHQLQHDKQDNFIVNSQREEKKNEIEWKMRMTTTWNECESYMYQTYRFVTNAYFRNEKKIAENGERWLLNGKGLNPLFSARELFLRKFREFCFILMAHGRKKDQKSGIES